MAMTGAGLADKIRSDMGFPTPVSAQLTGWGNGVVNHIQAAALVNHALITGTTAPGAPLANGAGVGGIISGMSGATMASLVESGAGYPFTSSQLTTFCTEIVNHIQTLGTVTFASGQITGQCTSTPVSPGPLANGAGTLGTIVGLNGSTLANAIHSAVGYPGGTSTPLIQFCTAVTDYIMNNADVSYASGTVTGTCPAGGGALSGGVGANGTIA